MSAREVVPASPPDYLTVKRPAFRWATVFLWQRGHSGSGCPAKSLVSCQPGGSLLTCTAPCCVWMRPQRHAYRATT